MQIKLTDEVTSQLIKDNETWNTCPYCNKSWKDEKATPGLLHRTKMCKKCYNKVVK